VLILDNSPDGTLPSLLFVFSVSGGLCVGSRSLKDEINQYLKWRR
jgi:hypothetical protein